MDYYNFYTGREFEAYRFLGAHVEGDTVCFRTFAPAAARISVIGDFSSWQEIEMAKIYDGNFWECRVPAKAGMRYKYRITRGDGSFLDHCDPYGFSSELRPQTASVIVGLDNYEFQDRQWLRRRSTAVQKPVNIYELHFGSWRKKAEKEDGWYSYEELGELLIPYLKENGYNYVELLPLSEHPSDESWGYQNTGFFAPTSRYGTPDGLRAFVDQCHQNGVGVIMDFVPVHFAVDDYALWNYDGTALYEYPHADVGRSEWGSCNFMHSRGEVRSFLQSAAYFWLKEFHFDGLRMDAVSNLIYWQGDPARGVNDGAVRFLREMNAGLKARMPDAMLIAEDSSAYEGVTRPVSENGLGFDYKWDLGWMNDTLSYFQSSPEQRAERYHSLTFSMYYYYNERYLLPLSHDEEVHGKATILQKMNGGYEDKFPQARALYLYMTAHPGKKLNFMGNELGQFREWDEKREQDWSLLENPNHDAFHRYIRELNQLYLKSPALYQLEQFREGFRWVDCHQEAKCVYVFERICPKQRMVFLFNFSACPQTYLLQLEGAAALKPLVDSDQQKYGGAAPADAFQRISLKEGGTALLLPRFSGRGYLVEEKKEPEK